MEEERLWKTMALNTWNVALNAKIEKNDFKYPNHGTKCLTVALHA